MPSKKPLSLRDLMGQGQEGKPTLADRKEKVLKAPDPRSNYISNLRLNFPGKVRGRPINRESHAEKLGIGAANYRQGLNFERTHTTAKKKQPTVLENASIIRGAMASWGESVVYVNDLRDSGAFI